MLYFSTRKQARDFAAKTARKVTDLSSGNLVDVFKVAAGISKRWGVKVI